MELRFTAGIDRNQFKSDIDAMRRDILGLNNTVKSETSKMDSAFKNLSLGIAGYFSVNAVQGFVRELINVRGEFQKTEIAFTTMLGNADQAKSLMADMVELAAKTPFSLQDVSSGAKQLLAFQVPANEVVDTLTRLGNIAAGLSVPLSRINLVYGQVKAKGKLMGDDLRQFTEAGIPMVAELAKKFGTTTSAITEMVSAGKIGFKDVQDVLFSMTNEGGMFYNLMEKQSKSLSGQIANLGDSWDQMLNKIGEANDGILSDGIQGLTYLVQHYEDVAEILGVLILTYGAYRTSLMLVSATQASAITPSILTSFSSLINLIRGATSAQIAFNAAGLANPIVAITTLLVGLGATVYTYREELGELIGVIDQLNETQKTQIAVNEELTNKYSKGLSEQRVKIQELIFVIRNEYSTLQQRENAYKKLISIDERFRGTLDSQFRATYKLGSAFDYVVQRMEKFAYAQAQMAVKTKALTENVEKQFKAGSLKVQVNDKVSQRNDLENRIANVVNSGGDLSKGGFANNEQYQEARKNLARLRSEIYNLGKDWRKAQDEANSSASQYNNISKTLKLEVKELQKGLVVLEAQYKKGVISGRKLNEEEKKRLKQQIDDQKALINQKLGINGANESEIPIVTSPPNGVSKAVKDKNAEVEKLYGEDTIKGLQQRISKLQEIIETSVIGSDAYNKAFSDKEKFEKRLKEIQVQSFDEQITELKRQFSVRDKLLEQGYSKETVDGMFPELKDKNFLQSMKDKAKALNDIVNAGKGDSQAKENLVNINEQIRILEGRKTVLEEFTKKLDEGRNGKSSSQYIDFLDSQRTTGGSETDLAKNAEIEKRIDAEIEAQKQRYEEFLAAHQSFEERRLEISEKYKILREQNETDFSSGKIDKKQFEVNKNKIDSGQKNETSALEIDIIKQSKEWEVAFGDMELMTTSSLNRILATLLDFREKSKGTLKLSDAAELERAIENIRNAAKQNPFSQIINNFRDYRNALKLSSSTTKEINKAQEAYNKTLDKEGKETADSVQAKEKLKQATEKGITADVKAAEAKKKLIGNLQKGQDIFNAVGQGVMDLGDAFGGFDDATNDAIGNIMAIGNAAFDLGKSIASGDVAGMIKAGVQLIGSIGKALSGDQKKERQIKAWADQVKNLKVQYQELERAMNKALGDDKYKNQQEQIANLERQKILLQQMIQKEKDKKKTDNGKIDDWKQQISDLNAQIDDLKKSIVDDILQIDVKGLADKIGDALIEGFGRGEDALDSLNKTADEVFKDMVKNALKLQLEKQMQPIIDEMLKAMGYSVDSSGKPSGTFDGLTPEERDALKAKIIAATGDYQKAMEQYADLFGPDAANSPNGLKGDIKGVTEKTAGALESQINAIRIYQVEALNISKRNQQIFLDALKYQAEIAYNTRPLFQIQKDIAELNSKVKKPLAGLDN
ncbi:MAG TPA: hypothetical protein DIT47_00455 [Flavobacteriaceae bacterium]|nr:hypothetical protein [Flavobacteriaceae bacterium]